MSQDEYSKMAERSRAKRERMDAEEAEMTRLVTLIVRASVAALLGLIGCALGLMCLAGCALVKWAF